MELFFHRWSNAGGPKLFFLHGMGGIAKLWRPIAASLEAEYDCLAVDQRGHGKSRQVPELEKKNWDALDYGRDCVETMERQQFHPTYLIGHSMGVRTACAAAIQKPAFVKGLVLVDLAVSGVPGGGLGVRLGDFLKILPERFESKEAAKKFCTEHCPDPSMAQYLLAVGSLFQVERGQAQDFLFPFNIQYLITTLAETFGRTLEPWIRELTEQHGIPVLILRGGNSEVYTRERFEADQACFQDNARVRFIEVPGCGHGLPFEKRSEFVQLIKNFVQPSKH